MNDDRNQRVVGEFTRQSDRYAKAPELNDEKALEVLSSIAGFRESDTVLDVACGPGHQASSVGARSCLTAFAGTPATSV